MYPYRLVSSKYAFSTEYADCEWWLKWNDVRLLRVHSGAAAKRMASLQRFSCGRSNRPTANYVATARVVQKHFGQGQNSGLFSGQNAGNIRSGQFQNY